MNLTDEQITTSKSLRRLAQKLNNGSVVVGALNAAADEIDRLLAERQAWKEEAERCQNQLDEVVETLKDVTPFAVYKQVIGPVLSLISRSPLH